MELGRFREAESFVQDLQVFERERVLVDRHVMEPRAARRVAFPGAPGGEEVEPEAEAGLEDHEALAPGPSARKAIAF